MDYKRILVDSIYINNSGGIVLLNYFVNTIIKKGISNRFYFLLDARGNYDYLDNINFEIGHNSERFRKKFYEKRKNKFDKIFCFGNVPPPVKLNVDVHTYFHNALLATAVNGYPLKSKVTKFLKRKYISLISKNTSTFIVQSEFMKLLISRNISNKIIIHKYPFFHLANNIGRVSKSNVEFVYISNGNPHKNHMLLLDAWEELLNNGFAPILNLTVTDNYKGIINRIEDLKKKGVKIINHGYISSDILYRKSSYLIYPSLIESFGLGLVESVNYGLKVLSSNLEYVTNVVKPSLIFNPNNMTSIVECVELVLSGDIIPDSKIIIENKIEELLDLLLEK